MKRKQRPRVEFELNSPNPFLTMATVTVRATIFSVCKKSELQTVIISCTENKKNNKINHTHTHTHIYIYIYIKKCLLVEVDVYFLRKCLRSQLNKLNDGFLYRIQVLLNQKTGVILLGGSKKVVT